MTSRWVIPTNGRSKGGIELRKKPREYERTCQACGTKWFVTPKEARAVPPNKMEIAGAKMQATGAQWTLFSRRRTETQIQLQRLEGKRDQIQALSRCRNCGSTRFVQQPVY